MSKTLPITMLTRPKLPRPKLNKTSLSKSKPNSKKFKKPQSRRKPNK